MNFVMMCPAIDLLTGDPAIREAIDSGKDLKSIIEIAHHGTEVYDAARSGSLLYERRTNG